MNESIDDYLGDILLLGTRLGRAPQQLACTFVQGLPADMQQFVLGTDNHTMDSYSSRAKLYYARQASNSVKGVATQSQHVAMSVTNSLAEAKEEIVNAVTDSLKHLIVRDSGDRYRDKSKERYRDKSRDNSREHYHGRGRGRNRYRNQDGTRNHQSERYNSSSRSGSKSPGPNHRSNSPYRGRFCSNEDRSRSFDRQRRVSYVALYPTGPKTVPTGLWRQTRTSSSY